MRTTDPLDLRHRTQHTHLPDPPHLPLDGGAHNDIWLSTEIHKKLLCQIDLITYTSPQHLIVLPSLRSPVCSQHLLTFVFSWFTPMATLPLVNSYALMTEDL
eukprot:GHVN01070331.1.p1 GENE.GHVN01070331.1~~GHVN01070331.1.p1  ORF type:complete len:102 (-),score=13.88 GHVN01070331.1:134-439(-)